MSDPSGWIRLPSARSWLASACTSSGIWSGGVAMSASANTIRSPVAASMPARTAAPLPTCATDNKPSSGAPSGMTETLGVVAPGDVLSVRPGFGRLTRDSLVFALGAVAGKAIGFLMLPVLTRLLTPSEFGRFDVISALVGAGVSTLILGMDVATTRLAFDERTQDRRALFGTWYAIAGIVVLPVAAILILASGPISQVLLGESAHAPAIA